MSASPEKFTLLHYTSASLPLFLSLDLYGPSDAAPDHLNLQATLMLQRVDSNTLTVLHNLTELYQ